MWVLSMIYVIVPLTGKMLEFNADEMEDEDGYYRFLIDDEIIAVFKKDNIAGYFVSEDYEDDEEAD